MKDFQAPIDDILFSLNHMAGATELADWNAEDAGEIATHFAALAENELAPLNEVGDIQGCSLRNGRVYLPAGFAEAYQLYIEQGWPGMCVPTPYGGQGLSSLFIAITSEIFSGANHSFQMVVGLVPGAVRTLLNFGTDDQQERFIPPLVSGHSLTTMCLTEPGAGSDLSRISCRASQVSTGWQLDGEKIFISGGDQNLSKSTLHLVLARTSDESLKGLSLFLCPSLTASGQRNSVTVTRIEEKMGLHASPTCQLRFDQAEAELIGEPGRGLAAMFTMMNHARIDVCLQGVAHAARASDLARTYAADRVQGRDAGGKPVTLNQHDDVSRMLDEIDWLAVSSRALAHLAAVELERGNTALADFLTPVAKVYCSECGIRAAELGMQVMGGYGYLREYRMEQIYRDARIVAIYEGANGIHERALSTRLAASAAGDAFAVFLAAEMANGNCEHLVRLCADWSTHRQGVIDADNPASMAHQFMRITINTLLGCIRERLVRTAQYHPDSTRMSRMANRPIGEPDFLPAMSTGRA